MGRQKDLHVITSCIEELMAQDGLESEQKDALVTAMKAVNHFRRTRLQAMPMFIGSFGS
jgi:hypothetical protein